MRSFFLFILLFSFSITPISADDSISETFQSGFTNPSRWSIRNSGSLLPDQVQFASDRINLSGNGTTRFPYITSIGSVIPLSPSYVEISFNFLTSGLSYGDGIAITDSLPGTDLLMLFPASFVENSIVYIWQGAGAGLHIATSLCPILPTLITPCGDRIVFPYWGSANNFSDHVLRVENNSGVYSTFLDGVLIFTSSTSTRTMNSIWIGHPSVLGGGFWSSLSINSIMSGSLEDKRVPVVVVPGHQATWNFPAMLGLPGTNEWRIPSFIKVYDDLLSSLRNSGYVDNTDLFVFGYDWRKNLDNLSDDLNTYINNLGLSQKVKIVGHSYGGLVARNYLQKFGADKVDKLLQVASPNLGTVNAYGLWEGGLVWDRPWWQKAAIESIVEVNKYPDENKINTIRRLSPSVKDLLPVFDYLEELGVVKPENVLIQRNTGLIGDISGVNAFIEVMGGSGTTTKQKIKVLPRNAVDALLGKWEDGEPSYPDPFITTTEGDDTVLKTSFLKDFSSNETLTDSHAGLVSSETSIKKIFSRLGLDESKVTISTAADNREKVLMVFLHSPGILKVCKGLVCNNDLGIYLSEQKMFMFPDYDNSVLDISVEANGEIGDYKLYAGKIDDTGAVWRVTDNNLVSSTETDAYTTTSIFDTTPPSITADINPAPNSDGWNNNEVTVSWNVSDTESTTNQSGCGSTIINSDTAGTDVICSASSNGGSSSKTVTVKIDKTSPTQPGIPETITPTNSSLQTWSWSSSTDSGAGVNGYWYRLSGDTTTDYSFIGDVLSWKTTLNAGNYQFNVKSEDKVGNQSLVANSLGLLVDTASPSATWFLPLADETISGVSTIQVNTSDIAPSSGIDNVVLEFKRNNGTDDYHSMTTLITFPYRYDWSTSGLPLDEYILRATVTDKTGNLATIEQKVKVAAIITNISSWTPNFGEISINWTSDRLTSTRVVYDTVTHESLDMTKTNFGYPNSSSTSNIDPKVSEHSIILSGLSDGTTYYWRVVSESSTVAVGAEKTNRTFTKDFSMPFTTAGGSNNVTLAGSEVLGTSTLVGAPVSSSDEVVSISSSEVPSITETGVISVLPTPQVLGETTDNFPWPIFILVGGLFGCGAILMWTRYSNQQKTTR